MVQLQCFLWDSWQRDKSDALVFAGFTHPWHSSLIVLTCGVFLYSTGTNTRSSNWEVRAAHLLTEMWRELEINYYSVQQHASHLCKGCGRCMQEHIRHGSLVIPWSSLYCNAKKNRRQGVKSLILSSARPKRSAFCISREKNIAAWLLICLLGWRFLHGPCLLQCCANLNPIHIDP